MKVDEPALTVDAIERRVPFDGLVHARDCAYDECIEAATDVAFPAWYRGDERLRGRIAVASRDLRVAAR